MAVEDELVGRSKADSGGGIWSADLIVGPSRRFIIKMLCMLATGKQRQQ